MTLRAVLDDDQGGAKPHRPAVPAPFPEAGKQGEDADREERAAPGGLSGAATRSSGGRLP